MTAPARRLDAVSAVPGESSHERILRVATRLFAERGFDGITTRAIAAAAGLNIATVAHHVGSKGELYEAVFARLYAHEAAMLDAALPEVGAGDVTDPVAVRRLARGLVDAYIDVLAEEPAAARLWTRRWLERGARADALEERFARPLFERVEALLRAAVDAGSIRPLDVHLAVKTVVWIVYGYFTGGLLEPGATQDLTDPAQVARLRKFVHTVVDGLLGPA